MAWVALCCLEDDAGLSCISSLSQSLLLSGSPAPSTAEDSSKMKFKCEEAGGLLAAVLVLLSGSD